MYDKLIHSLRYPLTMSSFSKETDCNKWHKEIREEAAKAIEALLDQQAIDNNNINIKAFFIDKMLDNQQEDREEIDRLKDMISDLTGMDV